MKKTNLRKLDWSDLIVYFVELLNQKDFSEKDLLDYFQFRYIDILGIERWVIPNYRMYTSSAKKLLDLYGKEFCIEIIDILFKDYETIFNKEFREIGWSIGLLSSDRTGWILERIFKLYYKSKSTSKRDFIARLLTKPRSQWTPDEREQFEAAIQ